MTSNIEAKGIGSAIKNLLNSEYKFLGGDRIQDMFVEDVQKLFNNFHRDAWNIEDREMRANGYSHKEIRKFRIARILREAFNQVGVLTQADLAELLGVSIGTVGKDIREYQLENQAVLPYRRKVIIC